MSSTAILKLDVFVDVVSSPRFCAERLDLPLLHPVPDAHAGHHVDVLCAV